MRIGYELSAKLICLVLLWWPDMRRSVVRLFRKIKSKRKHFFLLSHGEAFSSLPAFPFSFSRSFPFSLTLHAPASLSPTVAFTRVIMGNLHHPCPFYLLSFSLIVTFSSFLSTSCMQSGLRHDRNEMMKKWNEIGLANKLWARVTPCALMPHMRLFPSISTSPEFIKAAHSDSMMTYVLMHYGLHTLQYHWWWMDRWRMEWWVVKLRRPLWSFCIWSNPSFKPSLGLNCSVKITLLHIFRNIKMKITFMMRTLLTHTVSRARNVISPQI